MAPDRHGHPAGWRLLAGTALGGLRAEAVLIGRIRPIDRISPGLGLPPREPFAGELFGAVALGEASSSATSGHDHLIHQPRAGTGELLAEPVSGIVDERSRLEAGQ